MKQKVWIAFVAVLLAGCSSLALPDMRMGAGPARAVVAAMPFTAVERDFVARVAAKNVYEIEVSKLAADKALSPAVREFAQAMVVHHTQMNNELLDMMSVHQVPAPRALPARQATKLHKLAALPRSDAFDSGYMRVVGIEDHRAAIAMFEKARTQARDPDLRAFIERGLTTMRLHLSMAQGVAAGIAG